MTISPRTPATRPPQANTERDALCREVTAARLIATPSPGYTETDEETGSYHPQVNGTVERFHRQLEYSLVASDQQENWLLSLPLNLLGIRTSLKTDLHNSSTDAALPQRRPSSTATLQPAHVFVRVNAVKKPLHRPYQGPFKVLRRMKKTVTIDRHGSTDAVAIDRVKPAYTLTPALTPAMPVTSDPADNSSRLKTKILFLLPRH
ncbi:uncharacterized protein LOC143038333 [Oratosquilla oratoria]|uniref:uncharacterized protein LOC143038333 n=1 Tax=Oratosquilla oratoria TaxID=337810 RepID=UPI003F769E51